MQSLKTLKKISAKNYIKLLVVEEIRFGERNVNFHFYLRLNWLNLLQPAYSLYLKHFFPKSSTFRKKGDFPVSHEDSIVYSFFFFLNWHFHPLVIFLDSVIKNLFLRPEEPQMCHPPALPPSFHLSSLQYFPQLYSFLCPSFAHSHPHSFSAALQKYSITLQQEAGTTREVLLLSRTKLSFTPRPNCRAAIRVR